MLCILCTVLKNQRFLLIMAGFGMFIFFFLFSFLVGEDIFTQFDFDTTVRLQDNIPRKFDEFFSFFSIIGSFEFMLVMLLTFLIFLRKLWGVLVIFLFLIFHLVELFGKISLEHLPPPHFMLRTHLPFEFPQFYVRQEFSYPSGHSGRTMLISTMLLVLILTSRKIHRGMKVALVAGILFFDFSMLLSRIYLGEHWTTDVVGGALLGISFGLLGLAIIVRKERQVQKKVRYEKH